MKTKLAISLLLSSWLCAVTSDKSASLQGAWIEDHVNWQRAPADVNPHLQTGQAAVLYFAKDHSFAVIYCTVNRRPERRMTVSNGDPRGVYKGEWASNGDVVTVTYRLVQATIPPPGQQIPGALERSTIEVSGKSALVFEGKTFHREVRLDSSAHEAVYGTPPSTDHSGRVAQPTLPGAGGPR